MVRAQDVRDKSVGTREVSSLQSWERRIANTIPCSVFSLVVSERSQYGSSLSFSSFLFIRSFLLFSFPFFSFSLTVSFSLSFSFSFFLLSFFSFILSLCPLIFLPRLPFPPFLHSCLVVTEPAGVSPRGQIADQNSRALSLCSACEQSHGQVHNPSCIPSTLEQNDCEY